MAPIFSVRGAGHECFHYYNLISDTATPVTTGQRCQTARHRVRGPTLLLLTTTQLSQRRVKPRGHWPLLDPGQHCQGAALKYKSDINGTVEIMVGGVYWIMLLETAKTNEYRIFL